MKARKIAETEERKKQEIRKEEGKRSQNVRCLISDLRGHAELSFFGIS
jgi:hypothetical protein